MNPRILLVPSISTESGPVVDYTLIKSPAQNILCSSNFFLTTLHLDNRIRLWNTNDGRCIMISPLDMLPTKGLKLKKIKTHPGHILVLDNIGKVFVWKDQSGPSPVKNVSQSMSSNTLMLEVCNNDDQEQFKYELDGIVGGEDCSEAGRKTLSFFYISQDLIIVVFTDKIELLINRGKKVLYQFPDGQTLVFAKFFITDEREMLICVDKRGSLFMFDAMKLKHETLDQAPLIKTNLFENCKIFEDSNLKSDDVNDLLEDPQLVKQQQIDDIRSKVMESIHQNEKCFKFQPEEKLLYTIIKNSKNNQSQILTWSLSILIENVNYQQNFEDTKIPLFVSAIQLYPKQLSNCLINFNPIILRNYYNQHQFQFFFSDEAITNHVVYTSIDHPSLIIGTNYGRIFIISMFQETEEKVFPVILIDSHHQSPITKLFVAYNASRKPRSVGRASFSQQQQMQQNYESGGHLVSVSEDGTVAVTNLNSGEINRAIHNFTINERERRRAEAFMDERSRNRKEKRRMSIHQTFTLHQFYYLVKAKSQKVFNYLSVEGQITKVLEVKNLKELQEKIIPTDPLLLDQHIKKNQTPDKRGEPVNDLAGSVTHPNQSSSSLLDRFALKRNSGNASSLFALNDEVGKDGSLFVLIISNLTVESEKYVNIDSETIGIYEEPSHQQLFVLSSKLNIFIFNRKSQTLIRKGDFRTALNVLRIKETVEYITQYNECFQIQSINSKAYYDFQTFSKFFKKKNILMGLGNHKTLDFLSISSNFPLNYNPNSIYELKHLKGIFDLLKVKTEMNEFNKIGVKDEQLKIVLKAINETFFLNNSLYKSDFNQASFERQNGVINMVTESTFCNSQQQMLIINTKKMIDVMHSKANRISSKFGKGLRPSQFFQQEQKQEEQKEQFQKQDQHNANTNYLMRRNSTKKEPASNLNVSQADSFSSIKWPTRLLSLVHPFNLDENVDENLEQYFGLSLPFLDFRIGIQGAEESFSFVFSKEDEDFYSNRYSGAKMMKLLKLSQLRKEEREQSVLGEIKFSKTQSYDQRSPLDAFINPSSQFDQNLEQEPIGRFFNSEYWKISSYLSTVIPSYFLSIFVSIVEYAQEDIKVLIQDWLYLLQRINQQKTLQHGNSISMSALSKILLKKNHNISSTARDVIMKPNLSSLDIDNLKIVMDEWQSLIMDTYKKLKKESSVIKSYGGGGSTAQGSSNNTNQNNQMSQSSSSSIQQDSKDKNQQAQQNMANGLTLPAGQDKSLVQSIGGSINKQIQGTQNPNNNNNNNNNNDRRLINRYFGELEIRGLINLSYYSLYYSKNMDQRVQYTVSKLTTILTREIVEKFSDNKKYIHLLTILLQLLSTWMKTQQGNQKNKQIIEEVIKLLLYIFNFYKNPLNKEAFITRITAENFHLIRPTHSELYLKLTAAKALLEIGENFTHDFLQLIQDQATTLAEGNEYQANVLEILRYFINGYGENLEPHLIQLTQILLKCLDPNDLMLRKNSHKTISIILSIMVKMFPMVAFHHESQRLAVGTHDGPIAIYDARTSAKWKILEGHSGNVTCLAFDAKGNILCSYSSVDLTVRLWKVGNAGFFSTIMGGTGKCSKEKKLDPLLNMKNPHQIIMNNKLQSQGGKNNVLGLGASQVMFNEATDNNAGVGQSLTSSVGGKDGQRINKCSIKFIQPKEKDVELVREDGKKIEVKLVK